MTYMAGWPWNLDFSLANLYTPFIIKYCTGYDNSFNTPKFSLKEKEEEDEDDDDDDDDNVGSFFRKLFD